MLDVEAAGNFFPLSVEPHLTVGQPCGVTIGPSRTFVDTLDLGSLAADPIHAPSSSYPLTNSLFIGFRITLTSDHYEYGFIDLEPPQNSAGCLGICADVASYSIETSGAPIITGSSYAPEPSTLAFVASGLLGLLAAIRASRE